MKFNFACFALCEMSVDADEEERFESGITAALKGLWLTESDAQQEADILTGMAQNQHEDHYRRFRWQGYSPFVPPVFQIVPLADLTFSYLDDAQNMIEKAAVLQQRGCGISA
jgi:hypothetical protein